ncbi:protein argonaute-2-like isoform X4 [Anthonomus grandis grandis]|uniref:protein argonaute-2-like isoform X4 n=1 Tax=Anthonomus grandis grandis TaxID=2921223 RepID=UPI002165C9F5|nr:protein argonaute-2-like isoform X4 [Anthonomus grandis grandis]
MGKKKGKKPQDGDGQGQGSGEGSSQQPPKGPQQGQQRDGARAAQQQQQQQRGPPPQGRGRGGQTPQQGPPSDWRGQGREAAQQQQQGPPPQGRGQGGDRASQQQQGPPPGWGGHGGPAPQQQPRGPPRQQQWGPPQQQQGGPPPQQQQQGPPPGWGGHGGPAPQQQPRGPPRQQQWGPPQQGGPPPQQQQQGPPPGWGGHGGPTPKQQPRGPPLQQQQGGPPPQQQQRGPSQQQQGGPPPQQQKGPSQQVPRGKPQPPQPSVSGKSSAAGDLPAKVSGMEISEKETMNIPDVFKPPGTRCKKIIPVESNHFALSLGQLKEATHYDVEILENLSEKQKQKAQSTTSPAKEGRTRKIKDKVQFAVMHSFLNKHFRGRFPSFDGQKNLYASKPLHQDLNQVFFDDNIEVIDDMGKMKSFNITIKFARTLSLVPRIADPSNRVPLLAQDAIQCIDIVLRNAPISTYSQVGRSFFKKPTDTIIELGGGMEMYYGFYQSVVMGGRPMLNVHLAHKAFPKNMPVLEAFLEILRSKERRRDVQYTLSNLENLTPYQREDLTSYIKSLKVTYEVPRQAKVTYRVNGLARTPMEEKLEDGRTIFEYFRTEKNYTIKYPRIPLIWVGSLQGKVKIPPELCIIEKDQSLRRKMDEIQTSNMIKVAATDTKTHKMNTMKRFKDANYNLSPHVKEFGFSVNDKFERMNARVLEPPIMQYQGNNSTARVDRGTWRNNHFYVAKTVERWAIVSLDSYCRQGDLEAVKFALTGASRQCGIQFKSNPDYPQVRMRNARNGPSQGELEQFFSDQTKCGYDIIFVILPQTRGDAIYSSVKNASEVKAGCLTQCIKSATLRKLNPMTAANILLKVNGKLDGINHTFLRKPSVISDSRPFMLLGADVTHPGPLAGDIPSVAAIIASHDPTGFQYNVTIRLQEPKMEYIVDLKNVVKEQLLFFHKKNMGAKPEKIFYFRDGVSEGQFSHVLCMELKAIQQACYELQKDGYNPKIAFLVVQKRHHTRLFPVNDRDSEDQGRPDRPGNFNVPAGTCVDTHIVDPNRQNFYLVSHASIKGVSRPTKYCTLYDDMDLTNDQIQEFTYYLCHMFARCNRSVSYPAPTYYAHLGALRGKAYIKPALDQHQFRMDNLQAEQGKIKTLPSIHFNTPMFFI